MFRILVTALLATSLSAVEVAGVTVPQQAELTGAPVPLRGAAMMTYKWVFDLYVAGLYVAKDAVDPVAASPKRLRMDYVRDIPREKMVEATDETIGRGLTPAQVAAIHATQQTWNALYPAPKKGEHLTFDHLADGTLIMALNDKELGRVKDEAFARALFAIWIGADPVKESVRDALVAK